MLSPTELEIIRRSAAMAPLSKEQTFALIEECGALLSERARIAAILAELPDSWASVRSALNELQRLVR